MAFTVIPAARHCLITQRRLTTRQASLHAADRSVAPTTGLLTLGFDPDVSVRRRQPATGLPGNYPDRTHTGRRRRAYEHEDQLHQLTASPPVLLDALQILVQVVVQIGRNRRSTPVHPRRTLVRFNLPVRLPHRAFEISNDLTAAEPDLPTRLLPKDTQVPWLTRIHKSHDEPTPSLHPHYRSFITTTSRSACEAASVLNASGFRRTARSLSPRPTPLPTPDARQYRTSPFPSSVQEPQTGLTPPSCRTPPGQ